MKSNEKEEIALEECISYFKKIDRLKTFIDCSKFKELVAITQALKHILKEDQIKNKDSNSIALNCKYQSLIDVLQTIIKRSEQNVN